MSTPLQQQWSPPMAVSQQAYTTHSGHGSVGPVITVLAVITILGVIAGMIGRLCSGRTIMGHGQYDFESWVERKCSSCLDGRVDPPPPPRLPDTTTGDSSDDPIPVAVPVETPPPVPPQQGRRKQEKHGQHQTRPESSESLT